MYEYQVIDQLIDRRNPMFFFTKLAATDKDKITWSGASAEIGRFRDGEHVPGILPATGYPKRNFEL
jgi:hypothetical protein